MLPDLGKCSFTNFHNDLDDFFAVVKVSGSKTLTTDTNTNSVRYLYHRFFLTWYFSDFMVSSQEGNLPKKEEQKRSQHSEPYNAPTHAG